MSTYKELAEHLEAYFKNAHRMDEVIAILCSLDAQPLELVGYFVFTGDTWERAAKEYESDADVVKLYRIKERG